MRPSAGLSTGNCFVITLATNPKFTKYIEYEIKLMWVIILPKFELKDLMESA